MRYLCIDLGDKRTGLAVGDDITNLATAIGVLEVPRERNDGRALLDAIARAIDEHLGPHDQLVVGFPLNMDDTEGPRARMVRRFAIQLGAHSGRAVHLHDERLSSVQADWEMGRTGLTHKQKKHKRDALAAAAILRDFFAARGKSSTDLGPFPAQDTK
ncbi:MAG: Holliday junction resolvase RuvX [Planctomycetota bacterium]|nr:Holliday junction resolvase RuvX [Planctomycetota bacterium]